MLVVMMMMMMMRETEGQNLRSLGYITKQGMNVFLMMTNDGCRCLYFFLSFSPSMLSERTTWIHTSSCFLICEKTDFGFLFLFPLMMLAMEAADGLVL